MRSLINKIQSKIKSNISLDYDMSKSTWFRAGGNALGYVIVNSISDLKTIISYSDQIKYYIVGVGSNLMVRDGGFEGLIIKLGKNFNKIKINKNTLSVGAGVLDVNLAKFALQNSIKDFEFFSGIPGTIGGAIKMNAGCYGSQTADNLKRILVIDVSNKDKKTPIKTKNSINKVFFEEGKKQGIYLRTLGNIVMLVPPLSIQENELELLLKRTIKTIQASKSKII